MFFVIQKEKILSFVLAVGMCAVLLGMTNRFQNTEETKETASYFDNKVVENIVENKIDNEIKS